MSISEKIEQLRQRIADAKASRDAAVESNLAAAESADDKIVAAEHIARASTSYFKSAALEKLDAETLAKAGVIFNVWMSKINGHHLKRIQQLAESCATGRRIGAEHSKCLPILFGKDTPRTRDGMISRAYLERSGVYGIGAGSAACKNMWKQYVELGMCVVHTDMRTIVGYSINASPSDDSAALIAACRIIYGS